MALDEFRATQDEFSEFFGDVFDQLQALSLELFSRHKCLEVVHEQKRLAGQQQAELAAELNRMRSLLETLADQVRGEPLAPSEIAKPPPLDSSVLGFVLTQLEMS